MQKLSNKATRQTIHYGKTDGFNHWNYSFVFSDELPYLKRRNRKRDEERRQRKKRGEE